MTDSFPNEHALIVGFDLNDTLIEDTGDTEKPYAPLPGALETLRYLREQHIPFFIASNNEPDRYQQDSITRFNNAFGPEFSTDNTKFLIAHQTEHRKPSPHMLKEAYADFEQGTPARKRLYVGDRVTDQEAAKQANAEGVWFQKTAPSASKPAEAVHEAVGHEALLSLIKHLRELSQGGTSVLAGDWQSRIQASYASDTVAHRR